MLAYTYIEKGEFALVEKPKPTLMEPTDAIVRVTMSSICSSDLHIKHGSVPVRMPLLRWLPFMTNRKFFLYPICMART